MKCVAKSTMQAAIGLLFLCISMSLWAGPLNLAAGPHTIDTDTGSIDMVVSPDFDGTKFTFTSLTIDDMAVVDVTGSQPLIIEVTGPAVINGTLDLSGDPGGAGGGNVPGGVGGQPGAGGFAGGAGGGLPPGSNTEDGIDGMGPGGGGGGVNGNAPADSAGGGGGGHATAGENGSTTGAPSVAGLGGPAYASLPPLIGGSGGGGGAFEDDDPQQAGVPGGEDDGGGGGGGGGGAVQIVAHSITVGASGVIDVRGGRGGNANAGIGSAGGGGGAGGAIELSAFAAPGIQGALEIAGGGRGTGENNSARGGRGGDGRSLLTTLPQPVVTLIDVLQVDTPPLVEVSDGDTLRYTAILENTTAFPIDMSIFTVPAPVNGALVVGSVTITQGSVTSGNTAGDTTVGIDVGSLAAMSTVIITFDVVVNDPMAPGAMVSAQGTLNAAAIPGVASDDPDTGVSGDPTLTVIGSPSMVVTLTDALLVDNDGNSIVSGNDILRYIAVITNSGFADATDVQFAQAAIAETVLVAGSVTTSQGTIPTGNTGGDTSVGVDVGTVAAGGGTAIITFDVTVNQALSMPQVTISAQSQLSGSNFTSLFSDDADTAQADDPTLTTAFLSGIGDLQGIPSISQLGMLLMVLLLGGFAWYRLRPQH